MLAKKKAAKKSKKFADQGVAHIQATFNNTIITISDNQGNVIVWSSSGAKGFKGTRKGTPFAAQIAAEDAARKVVAHGMKSVSVYVKGPGPGREPDEDRYYAEIPALPGCYSWGYTYEEAFKNIKEALEVWLEVKKEAGEPIPIEDPQV